MGSTRGRSIRHSLIGQTKIIKIILYTLVTDVLRIKNIGNQCAFQAGIKGMDALAQVAAQERPETNITKFVISGASKVRDYLLWNKMCKNTTADKSPKT